jgi:hypothetical protein
MRAWWRQNGWMIFYPAVALVFTGAIFGAAVLIAALAQ